MLLGLVLGLSVFIVPRRDTAMMTFNFSFFFLTKGGCCRFGFASASDWLLCLSLGCCDWLRLEDCAVSTARWFDQLTVS